MLGAGRLFAVVANQRLSGLTFLHHQSQRQISVIDDLLIVEKLDEAVVGNVLDILVTTVPHQQSHADEGESDGNKDDAAPVKVWLVVALIIAR